MANIEHLDQLACGIDDWQTWRQENKNVKIDLSGICLAKEVFSRKVSKCSLITVPFISLSASLIFWWISRYSAFKTYLENSEFSSNLVLILSYVIVIILILTTRLTIGRAIGFLIAGLVSEFSRTFNIEIGSSYFGSFDFRGTDFLNSDLSGIDMTEANLSGANFTGANLTNVRALEVDFSNSKLTGACLKDLQCQGANFDNVRCDFFYQQEGFSGRYPLEGKLAKGEFSKLIQEKQKRDRLLKPMSIRLEAGKDDGNFRKISELIGDSVIEAIFDPYLNDKALENLENLHKYGVSFAKKLRLLTFSKNISKQKFSDFFKDVAEDVEIRKMKSGEHRRFLLLDDDSILILGCSWNQISKNEVVSIEFKEFDRDFFNSNWKTARKI